MSNNKLFTAHEVKQHNNRKSVWIVIRNDVYDVSAFLNEHPGGEDPLLDAAGQDATIAFNDVGHSADAVAMLAKYKVGSLAPGQGCRKSSERSNYKAPATPRAERRIQQIRVPRESSWLKWALLALGVAIIAGIVYKKMAK